MHDNTEACPEQIEIHGCISKTLPHDPAPKKMNFQSLHLEAQVFCNHLPRNRVIEPSMLHKRLLRQLWRLLIQQPENRSAELHPSLGNHPFGRFLGIISRRFEGNLKETEGDFGVTGGRERVGIIQGGDRFGREGGIGLEPVEHDHWGNDVSNLGWVGWGGGRGERRESKNRDGMYLSA